MARAVRWDLIADPKRYQRGFKEAERTTKQFHGFVTKTAGLIGGAFAAVQVGGFLKDAITEAREASKVGRQTAAVIKATGGAANVTAKDVGRLSTSLSNKVGVDDEVIAAGQNMLLTFKGVKNAAGDQNDVFNQATKIALDMTAALNQGEVSQSALEQSTVRLGKALQDPIKGVSALTRVGVTFTDAQKEQIKTLVESGRTMDAQKIILKELSSEFGGAAEAAADPWSRLGVVFGNVKESIGTALLPALNNAATFITDTLIPAAEKWWKEHGPKFRDAFANLNQIIGVLWRKITEDLLPAFEQTADFLTKDLQPKVDSLTKAWDDNKEAIKGLSTEHNSETLPTLQKVADFLGDVMFKQVERLITAIGAIGRAWQLLKPIWVTIGRVVGDAFLVLVRTVLTGAKAIVDSIPGGKSSGFSKALGRGIESITKFKDQFNRQMDAINDEGVNVTVKGVWVPPKGSNLSVHDIVGRAGGGSVFGPGTSTSDSIPAMLSTGEHVLSAREVKGMGGHGAVERIRKAARGFAAGGAVVPDVRLPSPSRLAGYAGSAIDRLAAAIDRLTFKVPIKGNPNILSFIRSVDPLPYIWGGVGPGGYDCSGLVGEVMARHLGLPSYRRYFTTSSIHQGMYGLKPGLGGILDIGVTSGTGHMAGSYMGMGFEAESTRTGIKVGGAASSPGSFARHYHLAAGGAVLDPRRYNISGDPGRLVINGRVFDRGGMLAPGQFALNLSGRPERVLPPDQGVIDYDKLGQAVARALQVQPPVVVVDDVHQGLKAKKRRNSGLPLGLS